jgi:hypothetical protein
MYCRTPRMKLTSRMRPGQQGGQPSRDRASGCAQTRCWDRRIPERREISPPRNPWRRSAATGRIAPPASDRGVERVGRFNSPIPRAHMHRASRAYVMPRAGVYSLFLHTNDESVQGRPMPVNCALEVDRHPLGHAIESGLKRAMRWQHQMAACP